MWIVTDEERAPDPIKIINKLPKNLKIGIILRHYKSKSRLNIAKKLSKICKLRKYIFLIANDQQLAIKVNASGIHVPSWSTLRRINRRFLISTSLHSRKDLRNVTLSKSSIVFVSPVYFTKSHPDKKPLGPIRAALLAKQSKLNSIALGGISLRSTKRFKNLGFSGVASTFSE